MTMVFRQIRTEGGCMSYVFGDSASKRVVILDPAAEHLDLLEQTIETQKLTPVFVIDTHTHADHYSGTHLAAQRFSAPIAMAATTRSARASIHLKDRQVLEIGGDLGLEVLATPGHTPDSLSFKLKNTVFTGDTLLIGGSGRTDFPGSDPSDQYESIYKTLGGLSEPTWVFPGHDYSTLLFSNIAHEKKMNPHWQFKSKQDFVDFKKGELLSCEAVLSQIIEFNLEANPQIEPICGAHTQCFAPTLSADLATPRKNAREFQTSLADEKSALFIDVRERDEYARGHIEGTVNIPLSELWLHWDELATKPHISFSCQTGRRSLIAAQNFKRLGLGQVSDLQGGYLAWVSAGLPVKR